MSQRLALSLAWFALIGQVSGFTHVLLERHAVCPEHGELVHVGEHLVATAGSAQLADRKTAVLRTATDVEFEHAHGHCAVAAQRRDRAAIAQSAAAIADAGVAKLPCMSEDDSTHAAIEAIFGFAPKCSPPA